MKEMEAKTENRYEYRKPQEKRKQMIAPDLFEFAYVPDWYGHLAELERLALPESCEIYSTNAGRVGMEYATIYKFFEIGNESKRNTYEARGGERIYCRRLEYCSGV